MGSEKQNLSPGLYPVERYNSRDEGAIDYSRSAEAPSDRRAVSDSGSSGRATVRQQAEQGEQDEVQRLARENRIPVGFRGDSSGVGRGVGLPQESSERKRVPLYSGLFHYFPDALAAVANVSQVGNDQHNPGGPLFWDRSKSTDQEDCMLRHLMELGTVDNDGVRHAAKMAWRALAILQLELEEVERCQQRT